MTWYDRIAGTPQTPPSQPAGYSGMTFQNPIQKANYIRQAMINPAAFVRQVLPNLPAEIANDPNQILNFMRQNMGVTDMDIQNAMSQIPGGW